MKKVLLGLAFTVALPLSAQQQPELQRLPSQPLKTTPNMNSL